MKAFKFLSNTALVFSLVLLASCSSDNDEVINSSDDVAETKTVAKKIEFKANIVPTGSSDETRATLESDYSISWDERDQIYVYCDNNDQAVEFGITPSSIDGATATFTNYGEELPSWFDAKWYYYAIFPHSSGMFDATSSRISSMLPTNQSVSAGRTYDKNALFMTAIADKDERIFNFMNIPALIKVTLSNNADGKVKYIEIVSKTKSNNLSGNFKVFPTYGKPMIGFEAISGADKKHTVKLQIPASDESQDFYLAVLPGRIDGLALNFEDEKSRVVFKIESGKTLEAKSSKIYELGSYDVAQETAVK